MFFDRTAIVTVWSIAVKSLCFGAELFPEFLTVENMVCVKQTMSTSVPPCVSKCLPLPGNLVINDCLHGG